MPKKNIIDDTSTSVPVYTQDDFVFCKKANGEITSCGFRIDSTLMKSNVSPFMIYSTSSDDVNNNTHVSEIFRNKTVPMGIYHNSLKRDRYPVGVEDNVEDREIDDDLYEKLLGLVDVSTSSRARKLTKKAKHTNQTTGHRKTKSKRA